MMKSYYMKRAAVLMLLSMTFSFEANSMYEQDEVLDYSGPSLLMTRGQRVGNMANMPNILTVDQLEDELKEIESLKIAKIDLSKNYLDDNSVPKILRMVQNSLPNLEILDLSFNSISEEGLPQFIHLLLKRNFLYLNIVGNTGAASIDGIRNLVTAYNQQYPSLSGSYSHSEQISNFLSKVIWLPESWLNAKNTLRNVSQSQIESHKEYYKKYNTDI